jgi:hypothetical protein
MIWALICNVGMWLGCGMWGLLDGPWIFFSLSFFVSFGFCMSLSSYDCIFFSTSPLLDMRLLEWNMDMNMGLEWTYGIV